MPREPRYDQLAQMLVDHSLKLKEGEKVLVECFDLPPEMVNALTRAVAGKKAVPVVELKQNEVTRELLRSGGEASIKLHSDCELYRMKQMDAYIGMRGNLNINQLSDVPAEVNKAYMREWFGKVHIQERVNNTRWVVLRFPNHSMAQAAGMSTEAFEDFYFKVCLVDYEKMSIAMDPLKGLMERTDRVRIKGPQDTDLEFSIEGLPAIKCDGERNIPDGECYTAPVRDSVNGVIHYNTPSLQHGKSFEDIRLVFKDGRIVEATASDTEELNKILDQDEGARYVGEFSLGFNPHITFPMKDTLFDEKIAGSLHFTPGNAYELCDNGNKSELHWDLVLIQTPDHGGGELYFDDVLVRKDGLFVLDELKGLNPENFG